MSRSAVGVSDESNIDLVDRNIVITSVTADNAGTHTCTATSEVLSQVFMEPRTYRLYVGGRLDSVPFIKGIRTCMQYHSQVA